MGCKKENGKNKYSQPSFIQTTFIRKFTFRTVFQSPEQIIIVWYSLLMFTGIRTVDIQISKNSVSQQDLQSPMRFG